MNDLNLNVLLTFAAYAVITGLLNLLLSERSRVDAWAESKPKLAAALKVLRAIGLDPWHLVSAVSLFFKGKLPQPKEPEAKSGKVGPLLVLLVACAALNQQACSAVPITEKRCSFDNPEFTAHVALCRKQIEDECLLNEDSTPRADCPMLVKCEAWRKEQCQ